MRESHLVTLITARSARVLLDRGGADGTRAAQRSIYINPVPLDPLMRSHPPSRTRR